MNRPRHDREGVRGGFLVGLLIFMVMVAAVAVLAWIILLPRAVTAAVAQASGSATRIEQLHANPFTGTFTAQGLVLENPIAWGGGTLARIPILEGRVDLLSLRKRTLQVETLTVNLDRLVIVLDENGKTNLEALGGQWAAAPPAAPRRPRYATAGFPVIGEGPSAVLIRRLDLRIGQIEVIDRGVVPARSVVDQLDYTHVYADVSKYPQIITPALLAELAQSPILLQALFASGLLGENPVSQGGLRQLLDRAGGAVNSFLQGLEQTGKP